MNASFFQSSNHGWIFVVSRFPRGHQGRPLFDRHKKHEEAQEDQFNPLDAPKKIQFLNSAESSSVQAHHEKSRWGYQRLS